ncbi:MAG: hypothetical protein MH321_14825 [Leptospiraceae bacterium]|nr:hypothetical protein [Leptospiraceae bacterium]
MKIDRKILVIFTVFFLCLPFALNRKPSPSLANQVQSFEKGWEFAWEDTNLTVEEILHNPSTLKWSEYSIGRNIQDRGDLNCAWFRVKLPDVLPIHPAISTFGLDHSYQMYIDGKLRDSSGKIPMQEGDFEGFFRLIRIPLQETDSGKTLYLRVYSNWVNLGFSINILLGRESDLLLYNFRVFEFIVLIMFALTFLLGVFSLAFAILLKEKQLLQLGGFQICLGLVCLMESHLTSALWNYPLLQTIILHACIVISPYFLMEFFLEFLEDSERRILDFYLKIYIIYIVYSIVYSAFFHIDKNFDVYVGKVGWFFMSLNFMILFYVFSKNENYKKPDVIVFLLGLASLMFGTLPQILWEFRITNYYPKWYFHWSLIGFIIALAVILFRRIYILYTIMVNAKKELEKQVEEQSRKMILQQKELIKLERNLAAKKERETILSDLHDDLGQRVFDLNILAERIREDLPPDHSKSEIFLQSTKSILTGLRTKVQASDDHHLLEENFSLGIRTFLFHRYELHNRQIILDFEETALESIAKNKIFQTQFMQIIKEITNNDLRYGSQNKETHLRISSKFSKLYLELSSTSNFSINDPSEQRNSRGRESLQMRVSQLNGSIQESFIDGFYKLILEFEIQVP